MFPRGAASEVLAGHNDVAGPHVLAELRTDRLESMFGPDSLVSCSEILAGDYLVRVNVITEFPDAVAVGVESNVLQDDLWRLSVFVALTWYVPAFPFPMAATRATGGCDHAFHR